MFSQTDASKKFIELKIELEILNIPYDKHLELWLRFAKRLPYHAVSHLCYELNSVS
jgi:hypothetical protein